MTQPEKLQQEVFRAVAAIFGSHPHYVSLNMQGPKPVATILYQDFLTPKTLLHTLGANTSLPVEWDIDRSMSLMMRARLLEELYQHPEYLTENPSFRGNVRYYIFDKFATTDLKY